MGFNMMNYQDYRGRVIAASGRVMSGNRSRCNHNVPGNLFELKRCLCMFLEEHDDMWREIAEQAIVDIFKATGVSASVEQFLK